MSLKLISPCRVAIPIGAGLRRFTLLLAALGLSAFCRGATVSPVKAWEESVTIPTYLLGAAEPNPMFYFGRASQGAEGRIYPYPLYDNLTGQKADKAYRMVYLENEYLKIGILPELGGRVFSGLDKTNGYDFFYRQHVIKPALIGLLGAWISGGVEWNIPHHHRASTLLPVQYRVENGDDGSKTVWVGELEIRQRMRWAVGYTLRPGSSYLEAAVRIVNRNPVSNTMLSFANVAVAANDDYQVIFPPRTRYVTYHSKREFATWPVATDWFHGADFSAGVDVSWYRNHELATSMFAWNYDDDFFAGYDHGRDAGTMSIADHQMVPGKKFFTWGKGARGRMWEKILTDTDGPYLELMVGAYSDNQPDYSWLQPYETRTFTQYWYPFRGIGGVKEANRDAAVNLEVAQGRARLGFCTTSAYREAAVTLKAGGRLLYEAKTAISPGQPYLTEVTLPDGVSPADLRAALSVENRDLVAYSPVAKEAVAVPAPVVAPGAPAKMKTVEELYLAGVRLDQFHNPSLSPLPYWQEALRRDPDDSQVNTVLGVYFCRRAAWSEAEQHLRRALLRLTANYTSPRNGEPLYYLGLVLKAQGRKGEARDAFAKATWSEAWRAPGYYALAEIACLNGDLALALDQLNRSLVSNSLNLRALNLKGAVLRHLDRHAEAVDVLAQTAQVDPLDGRAMAEKWLASRGSADATALFKTLNAHPAVAQEVAAEYLDAGLWQDGIEVLSHAIARASDPAGVSPLLYYYLAYFAGKVARPDLAAHYTRQAEQASVQYVFPFQTEEVEILRAALQANPRDAHAAYFLGNLLYDWQPEAAIGHWEKSAALDDAFPIVHRNLAQAYAHQTSPDALGRAIAQLEQAVARGADDYPVYLFELDQLYEAAGTPPETRLAVLEKHPGAVARRDDVLSLSLDLKIFSGRPDEAIALMENRTFNIWEGGTRFNTAETWTNAHVLRGRQRLAAHQPQEALADFNAALRFPENLRAEIREGAASRAAELLYWTGRAREDLGGAADARKIWQDCAALALSDPAADDDVSSGRGVQRYYQALALQKLGQGERARPIFAALLQQGEAALRGEGGVDYFASFGERQSQRRRVAAAHCLAGLGHAGLNDDGAGRAEFQAALVARPDQLAAKMMLEGAP